MSYHFQLVNNSYVPYNGESTVTLNDEKEMLDLLNEWQQTLSQLSSTN